MAKLTFTTVGGQVLEYEPVSPLALEMSERGTRKKYIDAGEPIEKPTYTVETAGGGDQTFEHDEKSILDYPGAAEAWKAYLDANQRLNAEIAEIRTQLILSAVMVELPVDDKWLRRQRRRNIEVPAPPVDDSDMDALDEYQEKLRVHYLMTEVLKTVEDSYGIVDKILASSLKGALTEEQIEAASASFRNTQGAARRELETTNRNNGQEKQSEVEAQS